MNKQQFVDAPLAELATVTGLDPSNLGKILKGKKVNETTLEKISKATGIPVHEVLEAINQRRCRVMV